MAARSNRRRGTLLTVTTVTALVATLGLGGTASASTDAPGVAPVAAPGQLAHLKLAGTLVSDTVRRHRVFVQIAGDGAADVAAAAPSEAAGATAAKNRRTAVAATAKAAFSTARGKDSQAAQLFVVANAVPGFAADLDTDAIEALAARSDVVAISPLVPKTLENASTAQLTRAVAQWQANNLGEGVTVGIIDTGVDYTHADFGGAGTPEAYDAALAADSGPFTPTAKVVGGYDFVGDDYDADPQDPTYQPVPHPDPNPLDAEGHGTHVAGIVAGYGVTAGGATFAGSYATLTSDDLYGFTVAPGMAPAASLYALKVFGAAGSTDVVIPALDWALDPNGDGRFSDHLDIVNLSLGSDYAPADDPENAVVDKLAAFGVLPVIAMGNAGDLTDAGGSPGNATRSLAVASSVDAYQLRDGLRVDAPADVAGVAAGQFSIAYPWQGAPDVSGSVVTLSAADADGCTAFSAADAAAVAGKIAWLSWDDNDATRRCGSAARGNNAAAAGAIGAIFDSTLDVFAAGITGSAQIPIIQLPKAESDRLRPALAAGTLSVTFTSSLAASVKSVTPAITDTLSSFSSRGTHGSVGVVKPDLAAPGDTVASAAMGTGNGVVVESGTSMATPNVAGIAALVAKAHPTWSTEQLKADLMNTAGHDVYSGDGQTGPVYGPNRVGAGRVDAQAAATNDLLVYDADVKGAVSASFGVVAAPITARSVTQQRTLVVENAGTTTRTVSLSYDAITQQPGVTYTVSPRTLTIKPGRSAKATVTLTVVPGRLAKTIDPTQDAVQSIGVDVPRQYLSDSSGRVLVQEKGKAALRVPVYAAVKPTAATSTRATTVTTSTGTGAHRTTTSSPVLQISGKGFAQGSGSQSFTSLASALELGATSPKLPTCKGAQTTGCLAIGSDAAGDLRYVGAGSSPTSTGFADGWLYFGINTWGQWAVDGASVTPFVDFDTTGDGQPDFEVYVQNLDSTDVPLAWLVDLHQGTLVDLEPVNLNFGDVDTNWFDSDTLLIPVWPAAIGVKDTDTSFPITYTVGVAGSYSDNDGNGDIDWTAPVTYDVVDPAFDAADDLYQDQGGANIPYTLGSDATTSTKALVLHLQGAPGQRAEVVSVTGDKHKPTPPHKKHGSTTLDLGQKHWWFRH